MLDLLPKNITEGHRNYFVPMFLLLLCFPKVQGVLKNYTLVFSWSCRLLCHLKILIHLLPKDYPFDQSKVEVAVIWWWIKCLFFVHTMPSTLETYHTKTMNFAGGRALYYVNFSFDLTKLFPFFFIHFITIAFQVMLSVA